MLRALTHKVSPRIAECEVTFIDRSPINLQLAECQHNDYCDVLKKLGVIVKELSENEGSVARIASELLSSSSSPIIPFGNYHLETIQVPVQVASL